MSTPINGLPLLEAAQNQKYLTANQATSYLDGLVNMTVFNRSTSTPPGSPSAGDRYIVGSSPTGAWIGQENNVAIYVGTNWVFFTPSEGWRVYDQGLNEIAIWDGSAWVDLVTFLNITTQINSSGTITTDLGTSANNAQFKFVQKEEVVSFASGAIVSSSNTFPNRSIPLFASLYNVTAITGPAGIQWYGFEFGSVAISFETGFVGNTSLGQQQAGPANPVKPAFSSMSVDFEDSAATAGSGTGTAFTGGSATLTIGYFESQPASS